MKPWELGRLTPLELDKLWKGYIAREKTSDAKQAYYACMMTNVHIPKEKNRVKIREVLNAFYPPTKEDKMREEAEFMREFEAEKRRLEGGE